MNIDHFAFRHTGPRPEEIPAMLQKIGVSTLDELILKTIPASIRLKQDLVLDEGMSESAYFERIRKIG
jgi:glycine dehydrogenase